MQGTDSTNVANQARHRALAATVDNLWEQAMAVPLERQVLSAAGHLMEVSIPESLATLFEPISHLSAIGDPEMRIVIGQGPRPSMLAGPAQQGDIVLDDADWSIRIPHRGDLAIIDRRQRRAICWFDEHQTIEGWHLAAPLRQIFHWLMVHNGQTLIHAAAVSTSSGAAVLTGPSGAGKSTTSLLCRQAGLGFLGDDYCVVEPGMPPLVHGLYRSAKATARTRELVPDFGNHPSIQVDQDKAAAFFDDAMTGPALLRAMIVPSVSEGELEVSAISRGAVLKAAAPTTVFQHRGGSATIIRRLAEVIRAVPCYHLKLGSDTSAIGPAVRRIIDEAGDC